MSAELAAVETQSVGRLSLPAGWGVVFKDEEAEKSLISPDLTLNVQQVLCARPGPGNISADQGAALQIFAIWGSDADGNEKPLPAGMFDTQDKFVTGLIGGRYGNVSELGEETVETALKNISVATYGVTFSLEEGPALHYKCAFLYRGGKQVLAMLNYGAESEEHWRVQLASLLNAWVGSLTFTPAPTPAPALEAALPVLPALPPPTEITRPGRQELPAAEPAEQRARVRSPRGTGRFSFSLDRIPIGQLALLWGTFFFVLYVLRKRNAQKRLQAENETPESEPVKDGLEAGVKNYPQSRALPTMEEWLAEKPPFEREEYVPPASSDGGFDRVYNLFDQALHIIDAEPAAEDSPIPEERP